MGKKDITLNAFLGDVHIFADLLNGCCFQGKQSSFRKSFCRWTVPSIPAPIRENPGKNTEI